MERKDQAERKKMLIIEDGRGQKTSFDKSLVQQEFNDFCVFYGGKESYESPILEEKNILAKEICFNPVNGFGYDGKSEMLDLLPLTMGSLTRKKMSSARKILRHLNQNYENIFKRDVNGLDEDMSGKQIFFNSNLLYLIAATDGNEDTLGHSQLVASYTLLLTKTMGIEDKNFLLNIERGALLHDIGKIGIPESILRKPGALTVAEREIVKEHPFIGYDMIEEFDFLKRAAQVVLFHHEAYDGTGYPYGLIGDEIPLESRIFTIADTLDALTADRPYRKSISFKEAYRRIERFRGTQFDPCVVDVFLSIPREKWEMLKRKTQNSLFLQTIH